MFGDKKIDITEDFLENVNKILNLFKKEKNIFYKDLVLFFIEYYMQKNDLMNFQFKNFKNRTYLIKNINNFS